MEDKKNVSKEELKDYLGDQATKLGEVFSQCWESEDFKKEFIADPKKVFDKYAKAVAEEDSIEDEIKE